MSEVENRFKALIQPIKDIASNWDIDIVESLTEYLEELDSLRISIDGGKSNLNFAEAALLIQGSTAVYSKKVEYLHQLVLQSLEFITNKKSTSATQAKNAKQTIEDDDVLFLDNDASFLLLDHVVEEGHNINLKTAPHHAVSNRSSRNSNSFASENNTSRVSLSLMHSILSDNQGSASLKLSTSLVDGSGALLICGAQPTSNFGRMAAHNQSALNSNLQDLSHIRHSSPFREADIAPQDDMYDDHGGDDWGGGGDDYDGYDQQDAAAGSSSEPMVLGTPSKGPTQANFVVAGAAHPAKAPVRKERVHKDMFAQLDPHQVVSGSREARRGKTYKIPTALLQPPPVSPSLDYLYEDCKPSNAALLLTTGAVPAKGLFDSSLLPILALKRKQLRQARLASARQDRNNVHAAEEPEAGPYQNLHLNGSGAAVNVSHVEEQWEQDYADFGSDGGGDFGDNFGGGDDDYEGPSESVAENGAALLTGARRLSGMPAAEEHWEDLTEEEALARRVAMVLNEDMNQSTRTSYESICQKYIDNFNQGAHLFAKETQLSRRVAEWTQRLEPILQQQEEAPQFDIHAYCEQFLEEVDDVTAQHDELKVTESAQSEEAEDINFSEVVGGRSSGEVCRVFLACLQLINQGSITITLSEGVDQWSFSAPAASTSSKKATGASKKNSVDTFKIRRSKPSSLKYASSDVENYRAPSVNDVTKKSSLKSGSGKAKGTKRVFMDVPSNTVISI